MPTSKKPRKPKTASVAAKRKPDAVTMLPDRRTMEGVLAMLSSGLGTGSGGDALEDAQDLMYRAWETADQRQRVALAKEALSRSPLCADAYVLLAEETAKTPAEAEEIGGAGGLIQFGPAALPHPRQEGVGHGERDAASGQHGREVTIGAALFPELQRGWLPKAEIDPFVTIPAGVQHLQRAVRDVAGAKRLTGEHGALDGQSGPGIIGGLDAP